MNDRKFARSIAPASPASWWAEATHNRIIALVLAMILAVPLLAAPADYSWGGIAAITLQAFALVLGTTLLWRANWDLRPESIRRFVSTGANLPLLLFFGLMLLSCILSPFKGFSIQELLRTGSGILLYFVVAYHFRQSKHLSLLAGTLIALCALVALGGMAQYQLFAPERASAIFGNPQPLASFVMLLLPVVAALAWTDKNPNRRLVSMIVAVLMLGCLMLTQGRSALVGALTGLAVLAWLATRPIPGQSKAPRSKSPLSARKHQLVWPIMLSLVVVGFLVSVKLQNESVVSRAIVGQQLSRDGSWQERVSSYWTGAAEMVAQRPLTGWGAGLYPVYQHKFTNMGVPINPEGPGIRVSLAEQAHNFYLQTAVELGLPGLLLVIAILVCFLWSACKRVREMEAGIRRTLLMGSIAATIAFALDAVASPSWQYGQTSMFLWLILGMGTSCLRPRVKSEPSAVKSHVPSRGFTLVSRPMAVALALVVVTLLPTGFASAQSSTYNDGTGGSNNVIGSVFGAGAVFILLSSIAEPVSNAFLGGDNLSGSGSGGGSGSGNGGSPVPTPIPTAAPTPTPTPVVTP